jgi:threonine dehydratase
MPFPHMTGREVYLKAENLQRTGSFKIRGAANALSMLSTEERSQGVVAASARNHAQGVALAAREFDTHATVFMPTGAAIPKITATRAYNAEVRLAGQDLGEAVDAALSYAADTGARFIHPYDDPAIVAGQGTLGLELTEQLPKSGTVVLPIGGGGLIAGSALALKSFSPSIRVVGVQVEAAAAYVASRRAGKPVVVDVQPTVAGGIADGRPSEAAFDLIEEFVDEIVVVTDDAATTAVTMLLERAKFLVEPAGAVALAAIMTEKVGGPDPVTAVLSGGNIDLLLLGSLVRHGLELEGRFASFKLRIPDEPGQLAAVLATVGEAVANVLYADHHREGIGLPFGLVEIRLSVATRSDDHRRELYGALRGTGLEVHDTSICVIDRDKSQSLGRRRPSCGIAVFGRENPWNGLNLEFSPPGIHAYRDHGTHHLMTERCCHDRELKATLRALGPFRSQHTPRRRSRAGLATQGSKVLLAHKT